jgi:hypothetical protein
MRNYLKILNIFALLLAVDAKAQTTLLAQVKCLANPDLNQRYEISSANETENGVVRLKLIIRDIADETSKVVLSQALLPRSGSQGTITHYESPSIKLRTNSSNRRCDLEFTLGGGKTIVQRQMLLD